MNSEFVETGRHPSRRRNGDSIDSINSTNETIDQDRFPDTQISRIPQTQQMNMTSVWSSSESLPSIEILRKDISGCHENPCRRMSSMSLDFLTSVSELNGTANATDKCLVDAVDDDVDDAVDDDVVVPPLKVREIPKRRFFADLNSFLNVSFNPSNFSTSTKIDVEPFPSERVECDVGGGGGGEGEGEGEGDIHKESSLAMIEEAAAEGNKQRLQSTEPRGSGLIRCSTLNSVTPLREPTFPEVSAITRDDVTLINDVTVDGVDRPPLIEKYEGHQFSRESVGRGEMKRARLKKCHSKVNIHEADEAKRKSKKGASLTNFVRKKWNSLRDIRRYRGSYEAIGRKRKCLPDVKVVTCASKSLCLAATQASKRRFKRSIIKDGTVLSGMLRLFIGCDDGEVLNVKVVSGFDMHLHPNFMPDTFVQISLACGTDAEYSWRSPVERHRTNPKYDTSYSIGLSPDDYQSRLVLSVFQQTDDPLIDIFIGRVSFDMASLLFQNVSGYYKLVPSDKDLLQNIKVAEDHEYRKILLRREEEKINKFGLTLAKHHSSCVAEFVKADGLAARAGIAAGDEIVQIDEISCQHWDIRKIVEYLRNSKTAIYVTIRRQRPKFHVIHSAAKLER